MVLRCKTLNFHIFEKMKIGKNFTEIFEKIVKKRKNKKFKNTSLTINNQKNLYIDF